MFVLEMHCFLFSILCSFFLPCKHFSHSAQELIKPPSKHSTDVKVKNSQAIHNKPSAENNLSKLFGENLRSNENAQRYLGRFWLPKIMKGPNDMFWIQLKPSQLAAGFGILNSLWLLRVEACKPFSHSWLPCKNVQFGHSPWSDLHSQGDKWPNSLSGCIWTILGAQPLEIQSIQTIPSHTQPLQTLLKKDTPNLRQFFIQVNHCFSLAVQTISVMHYPAFQSSCWVLKMGFSVCHGSRSMFFHSLHLLFALVYTLVLWQTPKLAEVSFVCEMQIWAPGRCICWYIRDLSFEPQAISWRRL